MLERVVSEVALVFSGRFFVVVNGLDVRVRTVFFPAGDDPDCRWNLFCLGDRLVRKQRRLPAVGCEFAGSLSYATRDV